MPARRGERANKDNESYFFGISHAQSGEHRLARRFGFSRLDSASRQRIKLREYFSSVLIEQWRGPPHSHWRQRKPHWSARRLISADHRVFDLLEPFARAILLAVDEFTNGIQRRGGKMASLCLVGKIVGFELADESRKRFGNLIRMLVTITRIFPFRPGE